MQTLGLEHIWSQDALSEEESKSWHATLQAKIQQREEEAWRKAMQGKPTYQLLKDSLYFEDYLKGDDDALKRRNKRTPDREGTPQSNEQRPNTARERASLSDLCLWRGGRRMSLLD
jgi:hypothetical protein